MEPMLPVLANVDVLIRQHQHQRTSRVVNGITARSPGSKAHVLPFFSVVLACLCFPMGTAGTEVVVLGTSKIIYLATDSVAVEMPSGRHFLTCKIQQSGNFFWAHKGFFGNRYFDPDKTVIQSIKPGRTFAEVAMAYRKAAMPILQQELPNLRSAAPALFDAFVRRGTPILQLYIVRSDIRGIEAGIVEFHVASDGALTHEFVICPPSDPFCLLTSSEPEMQRFIREHSREIASNNPINIIERMMEIARSADPDHIGPPYSILKIGPFGARWVRQNNCENIKPYR